MYIIVEEENLERDNYIYTHTYTHTHIHRVSERASAVGGHAKGEAK